MLLKLNINARIKPNGGVSDVHIEGSGSKLNKIKVLKAGIKSLAQSDPVLLKEIAKWHDREAIRYENLGMEIPKKHIATEGSLEGEEEGLEEEGPEDVGPDGTEKDKDKTKVDK